MTFKEVFWQTCEKIETELDRTNDGRRVEPELIEILEMVKAFSVERKFFVDAFITMLENPKKWHTLIVEFCMRELRFPEIYQRAVEIDNACGPIPGDRDARHVIQAYGEIWGPGHIFNYYKQKEPPLKKTNYSKIRYIYYRIKGACRRCFWRGRKGSD